MMVAIGRWLAAAGLLLICAACRDAGEEPPAKPPAAPQPDELAEKLRHCPLTVDGVTVELADAPGGVRFELTAGTTAAVDEVRRRAHHIAEFTSGRGRASHGGGKGGGFMRNCPVVTKDTAVAVEPIDGGVALVVTATAAAEIEALRGETRRRLTALRASPP